MLTGEKRVIVHGHPKPKGSLKCVGRNGRHQLVEDNPETGKWRTTLAGWFKKVQQQADKGQPVGVSMVFTLERPKSHHVANDPLREVKASAPRYPVSHRSGDVDKMARLLADALQDAGVVPDDCAVVQIEAAKVYPDDPGVDVLDHPGVVARVYPVGATS